MIDGRRVRCCIRPCRRSRPRRGSGAEVWICAKHWRAVDRGLRDEQRRLRMEFHRLRRSTRKCRYSPVALRRALIALWRDHREPGLSRLASQFGGSRGGLLQ